MTFTPTHNRRGWRRVNRMRRHLNRILTGSPLGHTEKQAAQLQAALDALRGDPAWSHKIRVIPPDRNRHP